MAVVLTPPAVLLTQIVGRETFSELWLPVVLATPIVAALSFLLSDLAGHAGKRLQRGLFDDWGGSPAAQMLSYAESEVKPETLRRVHRKLEQADKAAIGALVTRPKDTEIDTIREHGLMLNRAIGSPGYPPDPDRARDRAEQAFKRSYYPDGITRQMAAILADGDRREVCAKIGAPTLVLHGEDDPLVKLAGGQDTAAHIPGAKLHTIKGWGHDLPLELVDEIADAIAENAKSAHAQA